MFLPPSTTERNTGQEFRVGHLPVIYLSIFGLMRKGLRRISGISYPSFLQFKKFGKRREGSRSQKCFAFSFQKSNAYLLVRHVPFITKGAGFLLQCTKCLRQASFVQKVLRASILYMASRRRALSKK